MRGRIEPAADALWDGASCEPGPHPISHRRLRGGWVHRLYSAKAGHRTLVCVGRLQRAAVLWAEGDPEVASLCERAVRIRGRRLGNRGELILPLGVTRRDGGNELYAIHYERDLTVDEDGRRVPPLWNAVEAIAGRHGYRCQVLTDVDLDRHAKRIENAFMLSGHVRIAHERPDRELLSEVLALVRTIRGLTLKELQDRFPPAHAVGVQVAVAQLLHDGRVLADLERRTFTRLVPLEAAPDA